MNIHPLIVHFPIALWMIYCAIVLVQVVWWQQNDKLNIIKQFAIITWFISAIVAAMSGDAAQQLYPNARAIIHAHEFWAWSSQNLFAVIALITIYTLQPRTNRFTRDSKVRSICSKLLSHKWIMWWIWLIGIWCITITWALGWAISRGIGQWDPVSDWAVATFAWTTSSQASITNTSWANTEPTTTSVEISQPSTSS